jgi:hypothetical protein
MKRNYLYLILIFAVVFAACKKNTFFITDKQPVDGKALVKVGIFNMTTVATPLLIYNNDVKISGAITSPYPFPGGGFNTGGNSNGDYFAVDPGANKFTLYTVNQGTLNLVSKFFETTQNLEANKKYTVYTADTAAHAIAVLTPDDASAPDTALARIRFINLIPNSGSVDFYKGTQLVKADVKYKDFTDFIDVPKSTADSFSVRPAGSAPGTALSAIAYYRLALNTGQRILSFVSRGYIGAADVLRKPNVSVSVNQ